jgi:amidase
MFAAKDLIAVAGHQCCAGHPRWLESHPPALETAPVILELTSAGAALEGMTQLGALAYDATGENRYYGTPTNPLDAARVPGGSSSGSAVAVAAGLVDFALGTDSACSVRLPASYCGLFGIRPSYGRVPMGGVLPLSPSLDTVGWFARDGPLLRDVGRVLLRYDDPPALRRLVIATDAFDLVPVGTRQQLGRGIDALARTFPVVDEATIAAPGIALPDFWFHTSHLQACEVRHILGAWLADHEPRYGSGAFDTIHEAPEEPSNEAVRFREAVTQHLQAMLSPGVVLCFPTAAGVAPLRGDRSDKALKRRWMDLVLCSPASLAGLPQITLPVASSEGLAVAISLMGGPWADELLLELAASVDAL